MLRSLIWSEPADNESQKGIQKHKLRSNINPNHIYKYGADTIRNCLEQNGFEIMIRGHEVAMEGFETIANSQLITVTSCTNCGGSQRNSACILVIQKTFEIVPKILLPDQNPGKNWVSTVRPLTPARKAASICT